MCPRVSRRHRLRGTTWQPADMTPRKGRARQTFNRRRHGVHDQLTLSEHDCSGFAHVLAWLPGLPKSTGAHGLRVPGRDGNAACQS
ncbi:unnamed protein product [Protopolystoma xenopodis]|uniref:Uncharacterized protein n=1 Tax=Protopolystoma xenopodis TaxID=117903 RepID=A0A3S4ZY47_9PLAT|nr:unnamed protein product [Protopolystoma xenopodis]